MATTKKPVAKKTSSKAAPARKAPVKKTATKSAAAKRPATKSTLVKKTTVARKPATKRKVTAKKPAPMRSFHVAEDYPPFRSFKITRQTVYWLILLCVIIFAQLWILKVQYEVLYLLDQQALDVIL